MQAIDIGEVYSSIFYTQQQSQNIVKLSVEFWKKTRLFFKNTPKP